MDAAAVDQNEHVQDPSKRQFFKKTASTLNSTIFEPFQKIPEDRYPLNTAVGRGQYRKELSRRGFLKGAISTALVLATGSVLAKLGFDRIANAREDKSEPEIAEPQKPQLIETNLKKEIFKADKANSILKLDPGSPERLKHEREYAQEAIKKASETKDINYIDQAFEFITNTEDRISLLEARGKARESGGFGLRQLSEKEKAFCAANKFHTEWVAICVDSWLETKDILQKKINEIGGMTNFIKVFRPDLEGLIDPKTIKLEDLMLPVGSLIGIAWHESKSSKYGLIHGLSDIGRLPAVNNLKPGKDGNLEKIKRDFLDLWASLSDETIQYNPAKIPGGITGDIGSVQFRPDTAHQLNGFLDKKLIKFKFNPLGLKAVTASCLMLSIGQKWTNNEGKEEYRLGIINGTEQWRVNHSKTAMQRWNEKSGDDILEWAKKF